MALVRLAAASLLTSLLGCAPAPEAAAPDWADAPCETTADCEMAAAETGPRTQICGSRALRLDSSKDIAACGPMPNMTPARSEPRLACFRGTCVPVGSN